MKITKLQFKNINSIAGEWEIDFQNPKFLESGNMFCISGPTGAGKTTILDAICLALYGCTPRQDKINASGNEIMTYGEKDCMAKVFFECHKGSYIAAWAQKRARAKSQAKFSKYEWVLSKVNGENIEVEASLSDQRQINKCMEDTIGLDFAQFSKSIMLAQGEFNSFLKCNKSERANILEKLSGDTFYRRIAVAVNNLFSTAEKGVDDVKAKMNGIELLSDADRETLQQELEKKEAELSQLQKDVKLFGELCTWYATLHELEGKCSQASNAFQAAKQNKADFAEKEEKLARALQALEVEPAFNDYKNVRDSLQNDEKEFANAKKKLADLSGNFVNLQKQYEECHSKAEKLRKDFDDSQALWGEVDKLDLQKNTIADGIAQIQKQLKNHQQKLATSTQRIKSLNENIEAAAMQLDQVNAYLETNKKDAGIADLLPNLQQQAKNIKDISSAIVTNKSSVETKKAQLAGISQEIDAKNAEIERLGNEKEEIVCQDIPVVVEELQNRLKDGEACPVCGSINHPHCHDHGIENDVNSLNDFASKLRKLKKEIEAATQQRNDLTVKKNSVEGDLGTLENQVAKDSEQLNAAATALENALAPWFTEFRIEDVDHFITTLSSKKDSWNSNTKNQQTLSSQIQINRNGLEQELSTQKDCQDNVSQSQKDLESAQTEFNAIAQKRAELFGEKIVVEEKSMAEKKRNDANAAETKATNDLNSAKTQMSQLEGICASLNSRISSEKISLEQHSKIFCTKLQEKQFSSEEDFLAANMKETERTLLQNKKKAIDAAVIASTTSQNDAQAALKQHRAKCTPEISEEEAQQKNNGAANAQKALNEAVAQVKAKLDQDKQNQEKTKGLQQMLDAKQATLSRWKIMKDWFGKKDGDDFVEFVQSITLRNLLKIANKHLHSMYPRYELKNSEDLGISLIDHDNSDEVRPVSNISGGEGFLISLSLALGISSLASKNVKIDSMFMDEGFGTLDGTKLQETMTVLNKLQQEQGKMLGIISHMDAVKSEFKTHIEVVPAGAGRSRLEGAGVTKM